LSKNFYTYAALALAGLITADLLWASYPGLWLIGRIVSLSLLGLAVYAVYLLRRGRRPYIREWEEKHKPDTATPTV